MTKSITRRPLAPISGLTGLHPVLRRVFAARGIDCDEQLQHQLAQLLPYQPLKGIELAVQRLSQAIVEQQHIMIVGDYDADGATSTALALRALRAFGAEQLDYLVPNRFSDGYGLSPPLVEVAKEQGAELIITVDNGIASIEGVELANQLAIDVIITDHHLPGETLPPAIAIVNPNQGDDPFLSKNLAGVGVIFYLMAATRAQLEAMGWFSQQSLTKPAMAQFLDLVALGTVADMVPLDQNNRILVHQGVQRIRSGYTTPGIHALVEVAGRQLSQLRAVDLGFVIGPRLNAAGRLKDMSVGIECLLTDDNNKARQLAEMLQQLNDERRAIERGMQQQALDYLKTFHFDNDLPAGIALFDQSWHQGVVGIVAGRVKEQFHRPVVAFATGEEPGALKGSARSIPGLHIRDLLVNIANQHPGLMTKFGGHAAAAGLTLPQHHFDQFGKLFAQQVEQMLSAEQRRPELITDGELATEEITLELAQIIEQAAPWGQAFPEPLFDGRFQLLDQRLLKGQHLKMVLQQGQQKFSAIAFFVDSEQWPNHHCEVIHAVYRLQVNTYMGVRRLQLLIEYFTPAQVINN
ncbi:MAG: single-stranded-DNA-specific exonuclease RecJ [Gammaproteobacteria bacterium]|nr:single-stranded-DNA-specific exonuclease RecJ [Gammaproteobacteria bacterium]